MTCSVIASLGEHVKMLSTVQLSDDTN